jgi:hypothetical protein
MFKEHFEKKEVIKKETGERVWIKSDRFNPLLHEECEQGTLVVEGVLLEEQPPVKAQPSAEKCINPSNKRRNKK